MFKSNNISLFMGGQFTIGEAPTNAEQLEILFQSWADEVASWGESDLSKVKLSEVEIVKGEIVVTLQEGIAG